MKLELLQLVLQQEPMKNSSPARSPELPATLKPFFLTMKLEPMKMDELMASATPLLWSEESSIFLLVYRASWPRPYAVAGA